MAKNKKIETDEANVTERKIEVGSVATNKTVEAAVNELFKWALMTDVARKFATEHPGQTAQIDAEVVLYSADTGCRVRFPFSGYVLKSADGPSTSAGHKCRA
jgi:hypothetical protein